MLWSVLYQISIRSFYQEMESFLQHVRYRYGARIYIHVPGGGGGGGLTRGRGAGSRRRKGVLRSTTQRRYTIYTKYLHMNTYTM